MPARRVLSILALTVAGLLGTGCSSTGHVLRLAPDSVTGLGASSVVVPMTLASGLPMVDVRINGRGPYQMVVDTGCSGLMVSSWVAADARLNPDTCEVTFLEGGDRAVETVQWARVEAARIAGVEFAGFDAILWDMDGLSVAAGSRIDGIIGASLISACVWTLDYPAQHVELASAGPGGRPPLDGAVPLHSMAIAPERAVWTLQAHFGPVPLNLMLDTGSNAVVALMERDMELLRGAGVEVTEEGPIQWQGLLEAAQLSVYRIDQPMRIGGLELSDVQAMQSQSWSRLGSGAFADCRLELDLSGGWVRIERVRQGWPAGFPSLSMD